MNVYGFHIISVQILSICVVIDTMEFSYQKLNKDSEIYFPVWTGAERISGVNYNVKQMLYSAPCPPPWNVSLLCGYSCLNCEETTQLLRLCTVSLPDKLIADTIRICAKDLQCSSFKIFCSEKNLQKLCFQKPNLTAQSVTTVKNTTNPIMDLNITTAAVVQNTTDLGTTNESYNSVVQTTETILKNSSDIPFPSKNPITSSSNLHSLWLLLLLPYFLIIVPCLLHYCIKRRLMNQVCNTVNSLGQKKPKEENKTPQKTAVSLRNKTPKDDKAALVNSVKTDNRESFIGMGFEGDFEYMDEECPSEYSRSLLEEDV